MNKENLVFGQIPLQETAFRRRHVAVTKEKLPIKKFLELFGGKGLKFLNIYQPSPEHRSQVLL